MTQGVGTVKHVVAVASGKGGVGKSTVSVNLAVAAAQLGLKVGLLDADIYGPSQARLLGIEDGVMPDVVEEKIFLPIEAHGVASMSMAFLTREKTAMVWRGPMASGALQQMIESTRWGDLDLLLVDMPPGTGDIQLTLSQRTKLAGAVVVTTPQDIALIDARRAVEMFNKVSVPVLGMIQNMEPTSAHNAVMKTLCLAAKEAKRWRMNTTLAFLRIYLCLDGFVRRVMQVTRLWLRSLTVQMRPRIALLRTRWYPFSRRQQALSRQR